MKRFIVFTFSLLFAICLIAGDLVVREWLFSGALQVQKPIFSETENLDGKKFTEESLFRFTHLNNENILPEANSTFLSLSGETLQWKQVKASDDGVVGWSAPAAGNNYVVWFAAWVKTNRWGKVTLELQSRQLLEVYHGKRLLGGKYTTEPAEKDPGKLSRELALETGTHLVLIKTMSVGAPDVVNGFSAVIKPKDYFAEGNISVATSPSRTKTIQDVLEGVKARGVNLSHDGKYFSVNYSLALPGDKSETWTEIRNTETGQLVNSFRHASISGFTWGPSGNTYSYRTSAENKSTLWMNSVEKPNPIAVLKDVENLGFARWSPGGDYMIYSIREQPSAKTGDLKLVEGMEDRLPGFRSRNFLYMVSLKTGVMERLTHGFLTTSLHDISPDGKTILFSQNRPNYTESPFSLQDMFLMNLATRKVDTLWKDNPWGGRCSFSPDGRYLLVSGGPSLFGGIGEDVPEGKLSNSFDTQLFIYDLATGRAEAITRDFNPSVNSSYWNPLDNQVYITAVDADYQRLYCYNTKTRRFQEINTGTDFVTAADFSGGRPVAAVTGNDISSPQRTVLLNLRDLKTRVIVDAEKENYRHVKFGKNTDWNFVSDAGVTITGRVYYPPGFDPSGKYPVIVYYYAGTTPVGRTFGGRYPFNIYAANGYIVYVLQPSGAIGFGQAFSAGHVNNWGITVADEIIQGTKKFLEAHPYADSKKVGCMGASYGGFMTMLLQTRTDIFAAAISHAGISSISSYWGEGYWGYSYSAGASRDSYPWNNRTLYVDQSPLFSADKVVTPLLLLHGASDTNVPVGESIQFYTALKILGKPVELIEVAREDHHIITVSRRYAWHNTIMAWFDRWLKDQPEWWEEQYPKRNL